MMHRSVTRGGGLLEGWLARKRADAAGRLLADLDRDSAVLDIGCGSYPLFLTRSRFARRVGLDRAAADLAAEHPGLELLSFDIDREDRLPFNDAAFDAVTMLAVFEHIRPDRLRLLLDEACRVLRPGGRFIMTTPAVWTKPILAALARLRLVSAEEIDEHHDHYSRHAIREVLGQTAFAGRPVRFGSFELGMNTWATVTKDGPEASEVDSA